MKRPRMRIFTGAVVALALVAAACGGDDDDADADNAADRDGPAISIGAQEFGESAIVAEIYKQALETEGFEVGIQSLGGFRDLLFGAFTSGDVNLAPDYVASELEFLNDFAGEATSDVSETFSKLQPLLEEKDLVGLSPSDAVNTNAFVVTEETAEELDLKTLSDLADHPDLTLGGPQDCEVNAFCLPGLKDTYDVDLADNFTPLDAGVVPTSLEQGAIDIGVLFSTDGRIAEKGWVLLEDDKSMLAADNLFPVLTVELVDAYGDDLTDLLDRISGEMTTDELTEMNKRYDVDKDDTSAIASDWLEDNDVTRD